MLLLLSSLDRWGQKSCGLAKAFCCVTSNLKEACNRKYSLLLCSLLLTTPKLCGQNPSSVSTALARCWQDELGMSGVRQRVTTQLALTCAVAMVYTYFAGSERGEKWLMKSFFNRSALCQLFSYEEELDFDGAAGRNHVLLEGNPGYWISYTAYNGTQGGQGIQAGLPSLFSYTEHTRDSTLMSGPRGSCPHGRSCFSHALLILDIVTRAIQTHLLPSLHPVRDLK